MKKISFVMILANLFMFWGEQSPVVIGFAFGLALFSLADTWFKSNWSRNILSAVLLAISLLVIRFSFQPMISAESVIAFILFLASLKLFELKTETDYFHLFLILTLELAGLLILNPTFLMLIYVLLQLGLSFYFVLKLNKGFLKQLNLKRMLLFFAPAIPMGFLFFFLFPRFTSGFNQAANLSQTESGYSDRIDLDMLRPMNLSTQSIFKVKFHAKTELKPNQLYWRGSVLWETDGLHWTPANYSLLNRDHAPDITNAEAELPYEVFLEPGTKGPIFLLDYPLSVDLPYENYRQYHDGTYEFRHPMFYRNRFQAKSFLGARIESMNPVLKRKALKVRGDDKEWIAPILEKIYEKKSLKDEEKVAKLNQFFREGGFQYTLEPPSYKSLEEFFKSKLGYCSHFAAAYALLSRLSGIPARVVSGFQGGEYNSFGEYYRIESRDAHAWVEVYLENSGWIRIDPTEFVSPGRITLGARVLIQTIDPYYSIAGMKFEKKLFDSKSLNEVLQYVDYLNSSVSTLFYDFDHEYQKILSEKFNLNRRYLGLYAALSLVFFLACAYLIMNYLNRGLKRDKVLKDYLLLLEELERMGLKKDDHEGPRHFLGRVQARFPENQKFVLRIEGFIEARYGKGH